MADRYGIHPIRGAGLSEDLVWDRLRLNHYVIKSRDEFFFRKGPKGRATVVNQKKGPGYFKHHDKNDVQDLMPKYLVDATLSGVKILKDAIGKNAVKLRVSTSSRYNPEDSIIKIRGSVDFISIIDTNIRLIGWSVLNDGAPVNKFSVKAGDLLIPVEDVQKIERPDVVRHNPGVNILSGFQFMLPILGLPSEAVIIRWRCKSFREER